MAIPAPYDEDIALWAADQARLLHERRFGEVDLHRVASEIESIVAHQHGSVRDRLVSLVSRLLMWKYLPGARLPSWRSDMAGERRAIARLLEGSPSLGGSVAEAFVEIYGLGRSRAAAETGIDVGLLPQAPPFSFAEALDDGFLPLEPDLEAFQRTSPP